MRYTHSLTRLKNGIWRAVATAHTYLAGSWSACADFATELEAAAWLKNARIEIGDR